MKKVDSFPEYLFDAGELSLLTKTFDWGGTSLGSIVQWPEVLKTTLAIVLASNHPMFIWWGPDLIQFYNDAYRKTLGPERHPSALGQPGRECWSEIWPIIGPQIESIMAGGASTWHEDQYVPVTRHGSREDVWWTYGYSAIKDATGVRGVLVVCNDVTKEHLSKDELKRVNECLSEEIRYRQHEIERLKVLFQQAPGFMCILRGPQHIFEFTNDAYIRLIGDREFLGRSVRDAIPEVEGQGFLKLLDQVYTTGKPFIANEVLVSLQRNPGASLTNFFIDFVYQPIMGSNGTVSGIFVEGVDVTERKQAQDALLVSADRLEEGMVAACMAVWDWDLIKGEVNFSGNASEIFGVDLEGLTSPWELLHPGDAIIMQDACNQAISERGKFQAAARFLKGDEVSWADIRGKVLCDEIGQPHSIRGIILDVTDRKRAEEKLQRADQQKDEFLAMLAHELRNPLAPINAAAQVIKIAKIDDDRVTQASQIIARQVGHMTSLVDDLLDVARVTRGTVLLDKRSIEIKSLVFDAIEQVRPLIEVRRHQFLFLEAAEPLFVLGDRKRLVQVMANLLNNAAKYTPEGGKIKMYVEAHHDQIMLVVEDDGIGIDPDLLPRIFDLFTQAKRSPDRAQGGLGIGLSLVNSIVGLHGGSVTAESKGGGAGSKFTVMLPRHMESGASAFFNSDESILLSSKALRILIVDDNRDGAVMLSMLLDAAKYENVIEQNPYLVLERISTELPDVCILDIGLPGIDGNELARQLRATRLPIQPILIAITGYGGDKNRKKSMDIGFDYYMVKPVETKELLDLLAEISERRSDTNSIIDNKLGRTPE